MGLLPGNYRVCLGMNKDGKCRAGNQHLGHKQVFGKWYGQVPKKPDEKVKTPRKNAKGKN